MCGKENNYWAELKLNQINSSSNNPKHQNPPQAGGCIFRTPSLVTSL